MLFNSLSFLIFFIIIVTLYFITPKKFSWVLLLTASYFFYMCWKPAYILLILLSTIIDYFVSLKMSQVRKSKRKKYLLISLISNLGLLFIFKYFNFFSFSITSIFNNFGMQLEAPKLNVLLPVGISFYTFQTLSYTIDVYRGKIKAEEHFGIFAVYVSFFPQLVAGPIERSTHLLPQFKEKHSFDFVRIKEGLVQMLWGFFKKIVIADRVAVLVNTVYNDPTQYSSGYVFILATVFFAFQIYCDFSGYSDIAIGTAKVLGFDLMKNFDSPYFSKSIKEFWRRWHISLSTWFKDYVYIPLGGNRKGIPRHLINLFITFTISGLWHGASYNFVIWGMLNGIYLIIGSLTKDIKQKIYKVLYINEQSVTVKLVKWFITFILINIGWVFFRASTLEQAIYILSHSLNFESTNVIYQLGLNYKEFWVAIFSILFLTVIELIQRRVSIIDKLKQEPVIGRWVVYYSMILLILIFGVYGNYDQTQFIYFAF